MDAPRHEPIRIETRISALSQHAKGDVVARRWCQKRRNEWSDINPIGGRIERTISRDGTPVGGSDATCINDRIWPDKACRFVVHKNLNLTERTFSNQTCVRSKFADKLVRSICSTFTVISIVVQKWEGTY